MGEIADDFLILVESQREKVSDVVRDFRNLVFRYSLETVCAVTLERRMGFLTSEMTEDTVEMFEAIHGYQSASNDAMYGLPFWKFLPRQFSSAFTNLVRHKDCLYQIIGNIVDQALRSGVKSEDEEALSVLDQLLKNGSLKTTRIKSAVIDYITAGVDTVGNTALFAVALIGQHPEAQKTLQEELDSVKVLDVGTLKGLNYLNACLQEGFRMFPTASQVARILEEDTKVSHGHKVAKGSLVLCHTQVACREEMNFHQPNQFLPERWLPSKDPEWAFNPGLVVPFGIGRRICPGKGLAEQEIQILVATLFSNYNVEIVGDVEADFNFLLVPSGNFDFKLTLREELR